MTQAKYLTALCWLHEAARTRADDGDRWLAAYLHTAGLETVEA